MLGQYRGGDQIALSKSFVGGVSTFISALEVTTAQVLYFRAPVTSSKCRNEGENAPYETPRQKNVVSPPRDLPGIAGRYRVVTNRIPSAFF